MVLKFKSKLNSKFMLKRVKTIKIMKRSNNRRGLKQVKVIFFACKQTTRKSTLKYIVSDCTVRSEHHIDILNAKSIGKEHSTSSSLSHLSKSFFLRFNKKFKRSHQRYSRNQKFFRAGEVLGNQGTSINISLKPLEKKVLQGKTLEFFLLDTLNPFMTEAVIIQKPVH